jgi:hypothetical protein
MSETGQHRPKRRITKKTSPTKKVIEVVSRKKEKRKPKEPLEPRQRKTTEPNTPWLQAETAISSVQNTQHQVPEVKPVELKMRVEIQEEQNLATKPSKPTPLAKSLSSEDKSETKDKRRIKSSEAPTKRPTLVSRRVWAAAAVAIILVSIITVYAFSTNSVISRYIQVIDVQLGYTPNPTITLTLGNMDSAALANIGIKIGENQFGPYGVSLSPGEIQTFSYYTFDQTLVSSVTYSVQLTFRMADGKYETANCAYTMPQLKGQATITSTSLNVGVSHVNFYATIRNTGTLPITGATVTLADKYSTSFQINYYEPLHEGEDVLASSPQTWPSSSFRLGDSYSVEIAVSYMDGSTSSVSTQVTAQGS